MNKEDFRRIYYFIQQYMLMLPMLRLSILFPVLFEDKGNGRFYGLVEMISTMLCLYGLKALLTASKDILASTGYDIVGKFKVIQLAVISLSLPSSIINMVGVEGEDDVYSKEVMTEAWISCINCALFMLLSVGYRHYFNEQTAKVAFRNMMNRSFINMTSRSFNSLCGGSDEERDIDVNDLSDLSEVDVKQSNAGNDLSQPLVLN